TTFTATITARDIGGNLIDGPAQTNVYTIKQIESNDVAESFMKRVILLDNLAGNALGWNPDGVTTAFNIDDPAVSGIDTAFIVVEALSGVTNLNCDTTGQTEDRFPFRCSTAPPNDDELNYVVINLPSHMPS
ncbi:MAG: hypothetical protein ACRD47_14935, partial [Nitrososphaeraceae archaeon]